MTYSTETILCYILCNIFVFCLGPCLSLNISAEHKIGNEWWYEQVISSVTYLKTLSTDGGSQVPELIPLLSGRSGINLKELELRLGLAPVHPAGREQTVTRSTAFSFGILPLFHNDTYYCFAFNLKHLKHCYIFKNHQILWFQGTNINILSHIIRKEKNSQALLYSLFSCRTVT